MKKKFRTEENTDADRFDSPRNDKGNEERRYIGITDEPLSESEENWQNSVCMRGRRLCFPVR